MQVGSLVVCNTEILMEYLFEHVRPFIKWLPKKDHIYVVRNILKDTDGTLCVQVEEGIIGYNSLNKELALGIEYYTEIQPPMDISELIEQDVNAFA